jgi:curli biogenesis system outer membrane secretion channel CsgG
MDREGDNFGNSLKIIGEKGGPMKYLIKISFFWILIFIAITIFMSCAAIDRATQPTAKGTPSSGPTVEQAQKEDYMGPKARVAVTKFVDKSAKGKATGEIGDGMAEMLANALFATNRYIVLERQSLDEVIKEQDLGASGRVKRETAPRIGEIEGADLLIEGTITEFEPGSAGAGGGGAGRRSSGIGGILGEIRVSHVALIVKVIDAKTGRRLASEQIEGKATDIGGLTLGGGGGLAGAFAGYSKTPMEKAIRVAIEESVRLIVAKTPNEYYRYSTKPQPAPSSPTKAPGASLPPPTTPSATPQITPETSSRVTQVTKSVENLREGPGTNYKIIGNVNKGTSMAILEEKGNWLRVRLEDGTEAWIWKLSTSEAPKKSPGPSPTPTPPKAQSPSAM